MTNEERKSATIVYDTSFLVQIGRHDAGTFATWVNLLEKLEKDGYREVVSRAVLKEYEWNFRNRKIKDGLSLTSPNVLFKIYSRGLITDLPAEYRTAEARRLSRNLWEQASRKFLAGKDVSYTDLDIITFARKEAETKECFVCSYDEDILGTMRNLEGGGRIHPISYAPVSFAPLVKDPTIFILDDALKKLFDTSESFPNYLLVTRVDMDEVKAAIIYDVKRGEFPTSLSKEHEPVVRVPFSIFELPDIPNLEEKSYEITLDDLTPTIEKGRKKVESNLKLVEKFRHWVYFAIIKNKYLNFLNINMFNRDGETFLAWFLLDQIYFSKIWLKTYETLWKRMQEYK